MARCTSTHDTAFGMAQMVIQYWWLKQKVGKEELDKLKCILREEADLEAAFKDLDEKMDALDGEFTLAHRVELFEDELRSHFDQFVRYLHRDIEDMDMDACLEIFESDIVKAEKVFAEQNGTHEKVLALVNNYMAKAEKQAKEMKIVQEMQARVDEYNKILDS